MTDFVLVVPFCCPVLLRFLEFERFLQQFAGGLEVEVKWWGNNVCSSLWVVEMLGEVPEDELQLSAEATDTGRPTFL